MLSRNDFEAVLARVEKDLRSKRRRCKAAPTEALEQEVALLSQQAARLRVVDKFYLSFLLSGPSEDLQALRAHLPRLRSLPLAWLWLIGVDITRVPEGVRLLLTVKGAFEGKPGLLPGVADVLAMRFDAFEATATGANVDEALASAERGMTDQLRAHPRAAAAREAGA
jgi:hypothetical protein